MEISLGLDASVLKFSFTYRLQRILKLLRKVNCLI